MQAAAAEKRRAAAVGIEGGVSALRSGSAAASSLPLLTFLLSLPSPLPSSLPSLPHFSPKPPPTTTKTPHGGEQDGHLQWAVDFVRSLADPSMGYYPSPKLATPMLLLGQMIEVDGTAWAADILRGLLASAPQARARERARQCARMRDGSASPLAARCSFLSATAPPCWMAAPVRSFCRPTLSSLL